ncbi:hypothetical protein BCR44DRAFT_1500064 [Catenaria anguillulae PL171]|uniref:DUF1764-domain-containing protein n=1 Tax=Catenaria anguillulae PL171 TaxID=765915 RepID=A0A1Y2HM22_9FUNG|nr:hypothetical protein BCR44DRAFT_1500064 [Catenaria anguillulae PL171]
MAKSKKQTTVPPSAKPNPAASGSTPLTNKSSEIDDIFSSKPKPKAATPTATESSSASASEPLSISKKAAKKKRKASEVDTEADASKGVPAAPTKPTAAASGVKVVEFSEFDTDKPAPSAPSSSAGSNAPQSKKRKVESMDEFLGNNGKKRFTDDGYPLYYIEDLLAQEGGDTDLCPFECECCF